MNTVTCYDINRQPHEVSHDKLIFRPSVYGVIIKDGKVLLSPESRGYEIPGGGIELGETIEQALIREVKEETGLDVNMGELIDVKNSFFMARSGNCFHSILLYYFVTVVGGELSTEYFVGNEIEHLSLATWIELDKVNELTFSSSADAKSVIMKAIEMKKS